MFQSPLYCNHPRAGEERRFMTGMLAMSAIELLLPNAAQNPDEIQR